MAEVRAELPPGTPLEVWFQDEMRVGQKNKLTYRWARKGSRPRATHDRAASERDERQNFPAGPLESNRFHPYCNS